MVSVACFGFVSGTDAVGRLSRVCFVIFGLPFFSVDFIIIITVLGISTHLMFEATAQFIRRPIFGSFIALCFANRFVCVSGTECLHDVFIHQTQNGIVQLSEQMLGVGAPHQHRLGCDASLKFSNDLVHQSSTVQPKKQKC